MRRAAALLALLAAAACSSKTPDEAYRPTESVLEVVAVLTRHVEDDTYRFEPARDFTGRNVYRASLLRLESLEVVHEEALRAGHLDDVVAFAKGRALERLRAYDLAAASYRQVVREEGELQAEAERSAETCDALADATRPEPGAEADLGDALARHAARVEALETLGVHLAGTHYEPVVLEEIEHADELRAEALVARRAVEPDGDVAALAALQRLVVDHRESKNANAHLIELADLYAELAEEYVDLHPPESLDFDPPTFEAMVGSAARLYEAVANQDGAVERMEASRRLEAFLAFTLRVDHDRFTP